MNNTFIEFLHSNISGGVVEDDIMLETIMLVSSICTSSKCSEILYSIFKLYKAIINWKIKKKENKFLTSFCELLIEKGDDDEFVVQCLYGIYQILNHKIGIEFMLQ